MRSSATTLPALRDELGDLLFQVVFHSQMAREQGAFAFDDVVAAICDKMERRHPHVFGDAQHRQRGGADRRMGRAEAARARPVTSASVLADVPLALPALTRANKLGKRAAQVGFEWPDVSRRTRQARRGTGRAAQGARRAGAARRDIDRRARRRAVLRRQRLPLPRRSIRKRRLRGTNAKFERRFRYVEQRLREQGRSAAARRRSRRWTRSGTRARAAEATGTAEPISAHSEGSGFIHALAPTVCPKLGALQPGRLKENKMRKARGLLVLAGVLGVTGVALAAPPPWSNSRHNRRSGTSTTTRR